MFWTATWGADCWESLHDVLTSRPAALDLRFDRWISRAGLGAGRKLCSFPCRAYPERMGIDAVVQAVVSLALILGSIWAGTRLILKGVPAQGATGTLGSVLSMIEPATGAPTRLEAAAALEEMRQRRHESLSAGPGTPEGDLFSGKVVLPRPVSNTADGDVKI